MQRLRIYTDTSRCHVCQSLHTRQFVNADTGCGLRKKNTGLQLDRARHGSMIAGRPEDPFLICLLARGSFSAWNQTNYERMAANFADLISLLVLDLYLCSLVLCRLRLSSIFTGGL